MKNKKTKIDLKVLLNKPSEKYEVFHDQTKIKKLSMEPKKKDWPDEWKKVYYKGYARLPSIALPTPLTLKNKSLKDAFLKRESSRKFSKIPLSKKILSTLLYYSVGIKHNSKTNQKRFYPSVGARYPLEIYLLTKNTEYPSGLYHYYIRSHILERLLFEDNIDFKEYFQDDWIDQVGCIILITAVFKRNTIKYSDRGYRHILTEAGHIGQNFYLLSSALNVACCAEEGFHDFKLNNLLDVDGIDEAVIYAIALGNKK